MVECDPNSPPSQSASTFQHGAKTSRIESNPFSNKAVVTGYSIRGSAWDEEGGVEEEEDDSSDQPQILLATGRRKSDVVKNRRGTVAPSPAQSNVLLLLLLQPRL